MKMERITYENGRFPNDLRTIKVSDYKDIVDIGHSVLIEGKKYIVVGKKDYKCTVMDLQGNLKNVYYKCIDFLYFTNETARDKEIIEFLKGLNLQKLNVIDYDKTNRCFKCADGSLHSYSYLLKKYLKLCNLVKV